MIDLGLELAGVVIADDVAARRMLNRDADALEIIETLVPAGVLRADVYKRQSSGYLDVSVPRVVPPQPMCSAEGCQDFSWRVRPFGDPRVEGCVPLSLIHI